MPRINKIRLVNVHYNEGKGYYENFEMEFKGLDSTYQLTNGGGKSVLYMMLMQTLIPNTALKPEKPVKDIFNGIGSGTSHALVEWILDDHGQEYDYLITGFCARKKQDKEDSSDDSGMDYYNYVLAYNHNDPNSISRLPLIEYSDNKKTVMDFNALKKELNRIKDTSNGRTFTEHFDGRSNAEYRKFLRENYRIVDVEWEIMAKVNSHENNIAGAFREQKQSRTVIENFLVETVIDKINRSSDDEVGVNESELMNIKEYIELAREKYNKREDYRLYKTGVNKLSEQVSEILNMTEKKDSIGLKFSHLAKNLDKTLYEKETKQRENEIKRKELTNSLFELEKEEHRLKIIKKTNEIKELGIRRDKTHKELDLKRVDEYSLNTELNEYKATNDYCKYNDNEKKIWKLNEQIANAGKSNIQRSQDRITAGHQYRIKLEQTQNLETVEYNKIIESLRSNKIKLNAIESEIDQLSKNIGNSEADIRNNKIQIEEYTLEYDRLVSLLNEQSIPVFLSLDIEEQRIFVASRKEKNNIEISEVKKQVGELKEKINALTINKNRLEVVQEHLDKELETSKKKLSVYQGKYNQLNELCALYNQSDIDSLNVYFKGRVDDLKEANVRLGDSKKDIERQLAIIEEYNFYVHDAKVLELEEELSRKFSGVHLGAKFLHDHNADEREELLNRCSLLPYGILMTHQDFERLKRMDKGIPLKFIDSFLPIIDIDALQNNESVDDGAVYFPTRNRQFIRETMTDITTYQNKKKNELEGIETNLKRHNDELSECNTYQKQIDAFNNIYLDITQETFIAEVNSRTDDVQNNRKQINDISAELIAKQSKEQELISSLSIKEASVRQDETILNNLDKVKALDEKIQEYRQLMNKFKTKLEELETSKTAKKQEQINLNKVIESDQNTKSAINKNLELYRNEISKLMEFADIDTEEVIDKVLDRCRIEYEELDNLYSKENSELSSLKDSIENINKYQATLTENIVRFGFDIEWFKVRKNIHEIEQSLISQKGYELEQVIKDIEKLKIALEGHNNRYYSEEGYLNQMLESFKEIYDEFLPSEEDSETLKNQELKNKNLRIEAKKELLNLSNEIKELVTTIGKLNDNVKSVKMFMTLNKMDRLEVEDTDEVLSDNFDTLSNKINEINKLIETAQKRFKAEIETLQRKSKQIIVEYQVLEDLRIPENTEQAKTLKGQLDLHSVILDERIEKITYEYEKYAGVKNNFVDSCISIASGTYEHLNKINLLSRVNIPGIGKKEMVKIELEKPYDIEIQKSRMNDHIDSLIESINSNSMSNKDARSISKFIRDELSSKRLLSCITDMTKAKVFLYKIEEIPENSRHLRWEKAVESDGQTLMLYFIFLITVVLYVRNQVFEDDYEDHKALFVENPFGSASAIYLWQVMYQMLKENKIQLITTGHNISKELLPYFEVNYLLKHDLLPGKILRVMIDFQGQVDRNQMEEKTIVMQQSIFDN